jgi:hypothetical protein
MVWSGKFNAVWEKTANISDYRNGHHRSNRTADDVTAQHTPANSSFSLGFHGNKEWLQITELPRSLILKRL